MSRPFAIAVILLATSVAAAAQQTITLNPSKDNTLYESNSGNLSNAVGIGIFSGITDNGDKRRCVLAFDVAGNIPAGATITNVSLDLLVTRTNVGGHPFDLHVVTSDWGEGTSNAPGQEGGGTAATTGDATWVHTFWPSQNWTTIGGDYLAAASATTTASSTNTTATWSNPTMAADVQGWLDSPTTNHGWLIKHATELGTENAKRFGSRESASPGVLTITYLPPHAITLGTGCVGTSGLPATLVLNNPPTVGTTLQFGVTGGLPGQDSLVALALVPGPYIPFAGCTLYLNIASAASLVAAGVSPLGPVQTDGTGAADVPLPVPAVPTLAGIKIFAQATVGDPTFNLGFVATNGLEVTLAP